MFEGQGIGGSEEKEGQVDEQDEDEEQVGQEMMCWREPVREEERKPWGS